MTDRMQQERIPELDGLRGFAIFLVILDHYIAIVPHGQSHSLSSMAGNALGLGASGVDLFFILSGFLIGGILLDSKTSKHYYKTFYIRRFYRIIPLYYAWIILFAIISVWDARFTLLNRYWIYFVFLQNYFYLHSFMQSTWLNATWSLAVEEQFYLLTPPFIRNCQPQRLIKALLSIVFVSFILRLFLLMKLGGSVHNYWGLRAAYFATPSRADDLALGVSTAIAWRTPRAMQWIVDHVSFFKKMMIVCVASLLVTLKWMLMPDSFFQLTIGLSLFGAIFVSLLIVCLRDREGMLAQIFRLRILRELGRVSYCVYIIHVAVNWAVHKYVRGDLPRFDSPRSIAATLLALGVTLLIAELSWRLFEHPLIHRGHQYKY
jgi:peptidoglycan/LPS O-acetylase OafA/YrhL